jgi:hypothetical protein
VAGVVHGSVEGGAVVIVLPPKPTLLISFLYSLLVAVGCCLLLRGLGNIDWAK